MRDVYKTTSIKNVQKMMSKNDVHKNIPRLLQQALLPDSRR